MMARSGIVAALAFGLAVGLASGARAGGELDDHDEQNADAGPAYFGFVKDTRGAVISQAKVTAQIKSRGMLITHTNILGAYKISTFGKEIKADEITITCSKDGYKQLRVVERPASGGENGVEIECTLQRL